MNGKLSFGLSAFFAIIIIFIAEEIVCYFIIKKRDELEEMKTKLLKELDKYETSI